METSAAPAHGIYSGLTLGLGSAARPGIGTTGPQPTAGELREFWLDNRPWLRDLIEGRAKLTPYQDPASNLAEG